MPVARGNSDSLENDHDHEARANAESLVRMDRAVNRMCALVLGVVGVVTCAFAAVS